VAELLQQCLIELRSTPRKPSLGASLMRSRPSLFLQALGWFIQFQEQPVIFRLPNNSMEPTRPAECLVCVR
jgi:hypothetical protein